MRIAIITAKGGNISIPNKNLITIRNKPLLQYVIEAAQQSTKIDAIFVSTEDSLIKQECAQHNVKIIHRPPELARADSNHGEAILHAARTVGRLYNAIETVTILLGNSALLRAEDIDATIATLEQHPDADSSMTVWQAQDDHPYRAMSVDDEGWLTTFGKRTTTNTNRQSYPAVFFYDQGPWTVRYQTLLQSPALKEGPACWWWMGKRCLPVIRPWVTGKDVHTWLDVAIAEAWLEKALWELERS